MMIEVNLRDILQRYPQFQRRGIIRRIADETGLHRQSVAKLYHDPTSNTSMDVVRRLAAWLSANGVPTSGLAALFEISSLSKAILRSRSVTFFLPEYHPENAPREGWRNLAEQDVDAMSRLVLWIARQPEAADAGVVLSHRYVPFEYTYARGQLRLLDRHQNRGERESRRLFDEIKRIESPKTLILIGSPKANRATELFLADLFGCTPFVSARKAQKLPLRIVYRESDLPVRSCLGSHSAPPDFASGAEPGICFKNREGQWEAYPERPGAQDAGVVVVAREPSKDAVTLALLGFSGLATRATADKLLQAPGDFWPLHPREDGKHVGVFVCRFRFGLGQSTSQDTEPCVAESDVIPLAEEVL
jgi:hypothetical protein